MISLSTPKTNALYFGIGRRKTSVAKVIIVAGTGLIRVNHKSGEFYLQFNAQYIKTSKLPLTRLGLDQNYDIYVSTHGGGLKGQADAIKLGVARALSYISSENQVLLSNEGLLTRDSRRKERKKYGLRKARKAPQFSKR
jgi:small subunit ribosomal protein S9